MHSYTSMIPNLDDTIWLYDVCVYSALFVPWALIGLKSML